MPDRSTDTPGEDGVTRTVRAEGDAARHNRQA